MKQKHYLLVFFALLVAAGTTRFYTIQTNLHQIGRSERLPAAIPKVADISELTGSALETAAKRRLLAGAKSMIEGENFGVSLGHFITKGIDGRAAFACDVYDRVTLTFAAEGLAVSGERPTLTVEAPCEVAGDANRLATIWIPVGEIKSEKPADVELRLTSPSDVSVKIANMVSEWPNLWVLSKVKLSNRKDGQSIDMDSTNLYQMMESQISMRW